MEFPKTGGWTSGFRIWRLSLASHPLGGYIAAISHADLGSTPSGAPADPDRFGAHGSAEEQPEKTYGAS